MLSLLVVPAFFLIMDDLSRLLGWLFSRMVGKKEKEQLALSPELLTEIAQHNKDTISTLEERLAAVEKRLPDQQRKTGEGGKVIPLPPLAAE